MVLPEMPGYPRTYHTSLGWKVFGLVFGTTLALGGVALAFFDPRLDREPAGELVIGLTGILFALWGVYVFVSVLRSRLLLFSDRIEIHGAIQTRSLARDEILGWRVLPQSAGFALVPRDARQRTAKIAQTLKFDDGFYEWLDSFPCLDVVDQMRVEEEIASDPNLGATTDERLAVLNKWRRLSWWIALIGIVVSLWGFAYPRPYFPVALGLMLLPLLNLVLVVRSKGILRVDQSKNDPRPTAAIGIMLPPFALAMRALNDFYIVHWEGAMWLTIVVALAFGCAAARAGSTVLRNRGGLTAIAFIAIIYGYGAGLVANGVFDHSPPTSYEATVLNKRISHGKTTTYQVKLNPWGPKQQRSTVAVEPSIFKVIEPGDTVILWVKHGALGVQWFGVYSFRKRDA